MSGKIKINGKLRAYVQAPLLLGIILILVNLGIYLVDLRAGVILSAFAAVYVVTIACMIIFARPAMNAELISFATEYGQIQKQLLKELELPHALLDESGCVIWMNKAFEKLGSKDRFHKKNIHSFMPEMKRELFPEGEEIKDIDLVFEEKDYKARIKRICLKDMASLTDMKENEVRMLHREVGVLFQGSALFDSMTVLENVLFPLRMFGKMSQSEMEERARFCLKRVQIAEHALELMPSEISGGMQKRVAIARAIALNPKYLFCDEPNSGLDPQTSLVIDKLIQNITQEYNICTIVNTHDMNSIMEVGDNIIFLKGGKKEWEGSRNEIFHADNEALNNFVFASQLYQEIRKVHK